MSITRAQILHAAKAMPPAERYDLMEDIRQILDDDEFTAEQVAEFKDRMARADRGEGSSVPVEQAIAELRDKLRNKRRRRAS